MLSKISKTIEGGVVMSRNSDSSSAYDPSDDEAVQRRQEKRKKKASENPLSVFDEHFDSSEGEGFVSSEEEGAKFSETAKLKCFRKYADTDGDGSLVFEMKQMFSKGRYNSPSLPLTVPAEDLLHWLVKIHKTMIECAEEYRGFTGNQKGRAKKEVSLLKEMTKLLKCNDKKGAGIVAEALDQAMSEKLLVAFIEKYPDNKGDLEKYLAFSKYKNYVPAIRKIEGKQSAQASKENALTERLNSQTTEIKGLKDEVSALRELVLQQNKMLTEILSRLGAQPSPQRSTSPKMF